LDKQSKLHLKNSKIIDLMSKNVVTTYPNQTLYDAAQIMGEKHIGSLVVMLYDTPVGMITERDLLNVVSQGVDLEKDWIGGGDSIRDQKVESIMSFPVTKICLTSSVKEAARIMIEKKIRRLVVCDSEKLSGILTASDMIGNLPEVEETMKVWFEVDYFMSKKVVTADEKTLVDQIALIMSEKKIGSVIITRDNKPFGIFTERDLLTKFLAKDQSLIMEVGDACSYPLVTAPIGISVHDAALIMNSKHIRRLPITKNNELVGILSARDLVEVYARK
jgi:CBS domain-containing protein